MRIYVTHCSATKDDSLRGSLTIVTPEKLYSSTPIRRFMAKCSERNVRWAIFSDKYGIWFPEERHEWYEKHPKSVTDGEFKVLLDSFDRRLKHFDEIMFYHNPGRFHPLYQRVLDETQLRDKVEKLSHLRKIT